MSRHSVIPRTMCLIFHQDKVLLMKAADHKDWAGHYDPVGGHIEKGENILASAQREIYEETGLQINDVSLKGILHVSDFFGKNIMMFVVVGHSNSDQVTANDEGELRWVSASELNSLPILDDVKPIIKQVLGMKESQLLVGTSVFNGENQLLSLDLQLQ